MPSIDIDFEGVETQQSETLSSEQNNKLPNNKEDVTELGEKSNNDITSKDNSKDLEENNKDNNKETPKEKENNVEEKDDTTFSSMGELTPGTKLEVDGEVYTVSENGDILDKDNKVFKTKDEVKDWVNSFEETPETEITIEGIQNKLGIDIVDEQGKPINFENNPEGVNSYINAVIELKSNELQEAAVNKLFADNPILKQFNDYVQVTGSHEGFGEIPDRSGITVDKNNDAQQEYIIRMAAQEFGNKIINDNYIKYLRDTGGLYDEAVEQLKALQQKDKDNIAEMAKRAEEARATEAKELNEYFGKIRKTIDSGVIAGYRIPSSIVKDIDGKKQTLTTNDFYTYISKQSETDANGRKITAYMKDLLNESEEHLMNRDLLTAWLMFTGGDLKDLVDMAVKDDQVRVLKLKSKQNSTRRAIKLVKPQNSKVDYNDILLG